MAFSNNMSQQGHGVSLSDLASMQEQLNQMQHMFQKMTQAISSGTQQQRFSAPLNPMYAQSHHAPHFPSTPHLNHSTVQLMQEMLNSMQTQIGPSMPSTSKPANVPQMMAMLQHNPQMLQALISKAQNLSNQTSSTQAQNAMLAPNVDANLPPAGSATFSLPPTLPPVNQISIPPLQPANIPWSGNNFPLSTLQQPNRTGLAVPPVVPPSAYSFTHTTPAIDTSVPPPQLPMSHNTHNVPAGQDTRCQNNGKRALDRSGERNWEREDSRRKDRDTDRYRNGDDGRHGRDSDRRNQHTRQETGRDEFRNRDKIIGSSGRNDDRSRFRSDERTRDRQWQSDKSSKGHGHRDDERCDRRTDSRRVGWGTNDADSKHNYRNSNSRTRDPDNRTHFRERPPNQSRNDDRNRERDHYRNEQRDSRANRSGDDGRNRATHDNQNQPRDHSSHWPTADRKFEKDGSMQRSGDMGRDRPGDKGSWRRESSSNRPRNSSQSDRGRGRGDGAGLHRSGNDNRSSDRNTGPSNANWGRHDSFVATNKVKSEPVEYAGSSSRSNCFNQPTSRGRSVGRGHNRPAPKYPPPRQIPKQYQTLDNDKDPSPQTTPSRGVKRSREVKDKGSPKTKGSEANGLKEKAAKKGSETSDDDFSSDECSSSSLSSDDEYWGKGDKSTQSNDNTRMTIKDLYGTFDEKAIKNVESTMLPDYIESTPAGKYLVKNTQTGNMVATPALVDLENQFEHDVLMRASRAREGREVYKYPERTARLACCKKDGCAHESEDDATDESDLEEGELEDDSDDGEVSESREGKSGDGLTKKSKPVLSAEVQAKINHPERLHKFLCFNDKGETNYGPLCKCSRKARRVGVRHGFYAGESLIENCDAEGSNIDRLYHYRLSLTPLFNFKVNSPTTIVWDERNYTFDGFSFFTHRKLEQDVSFKTILYSSYYTIKLVEEIKPTMFTVRSLDLVTDYLFNELFEIADLTWVQDAFKDGCRQIHVMPRFTRPLPDNGLEILAMPHVVKYLLDNSHPVVEDDKLAAVASMDKKIWLEKIVKKYQFTLVTIPGMRPSTLRVDNMDRPAQDSLIIRYPQILHYVKITENLAMPDNEQCLNLLKRQKKLLRALNRRAVSEGTKKISAELKSVQKELYNLRVECSKSGDGCASREPIVELSSQGFFATGLRCDVTQWALLMPKVLDNVRFVQSLSNLQNEMGYQFNNPFYLQLALTHPSYISCASLNQDHIRNTQTHCGLRRLQYGNYPVYKELRVKKKGLKTLLEIMSLKYRQYTGPIYSYERLEFLGDAVLEFITTVHLYYTFPKLEEGGLSTFRTAVIKNEHLTHLSKILGVQHYVLYAHGMDLCSSVQFDHTLANAFEAILGAIFLDGGIDMADQFLSKFLAKSLDFPEFVPCWTRLPPHPLQAMYPNGDRQLIEAAPALRRCTEFEELTGLKFTNICLLARALTHNSMGYTDFAQGSNQTMEFLGDSILQMIVSDYLFNKYPNHHEGHLTLLRSSLVNNVTQAEIFKDIGMKKFVYRKLYTDIPTKESADYIEALIGALYVDQGIVSCRAFCKILFFPRLKATIENQNWNDPKSLLQQCCLELRDLNAAGDPHLPTYKVIGQQGPTHNRKFRVAVYFKDQRIGVGEEKSIQKAQFEAAQNALDSNREMFPMLLPGTNKFITKKSSMKVRTIQLKLERRMKKDQRLKYMESYWN